MEKFKKFIPAIIGVILIGVGVFMYFRAGQLTKVCTEGTTATVVSMREDMTSDADSGMRYLYYPIIEYVVGDRTMTKELGSGSNPPAYSINDKVEILYNPSNVEEFIVKGENQNIAWIIFGAVGILSLGAGIYTIIKQ